MATRATDNPFPSVLFVETEAADLADNPATGQRRLIVDPSDHLLYLVDTAGTPTAVGGAGGAVATDAIWDAAGDLVQGTGANTAAKLTLGAAGTVVRSTGSTNAYDYPPGYEFDYAQITSGGNITATVEASANTLITGSAVAYDGSTVVMIEAYFMGVSCPASQNTYLLLFDGSTSLGYIWQSSVGSGSFSVYVARRLTPSAATHTYSIRAIVTSGTGTYSAGAGGTGANMPSFIRITKV